MEPIMSLRDWQNAFIEGYFDAKDLEVQKKAGWISWACGDSQLAWRLVSLGNMLCMVKGGGKVNLDNDYVTFKNIRPTPQADYTYDIVHIEHAGDSWDHGITICRKVKPKGPLWSVDTPAQWDMSFTKTNALVNWLNKP